jgi:SNF2 family DNA or RNA helicase
MIFKPRDYQFQMGEFALAKPRVNWWAGPGTGKTGAAYWAIDQAMRFDDVQRVLVLSTKNICTLVWGREAEKWENFRHFKVAVAVGTPAERLTAVRSNAQITTCNYDNLPWLVETMGDDWPWDMVIADESSKLRALRIEVRRHHTSGKAFLRSGGGSTRAEKVARIAHKKVRRWLNLTGSPAANSLEALWGQMWYLDAGARLGRSFNSFRERWFNAVRSSDAHEIIYRPTPFAQGQIEDAIRDVTISINARDYMDLPATLTNVITVTLPPDAYERYREMEKEFFTQIAGSEIEAVSAGSKSMKCRQIASGAAYIEPDDGSDTKPWVLVHDAKLDALEDLIAGLHGAPLMIAYYFKSDLARLLKRFPKGRHFDGKRGTLNDFIAGKYQLMFINPRSGGHGIDGMQQVCQDIAFFSMTWDLEEFEQVIERIGAVRQVSAGFFRDVRVHLLAAEDTIDEDMIERTKTKASVQDALKNAMKRRG